VARGPEGRAALKEWRLETPLDENPKDPQKFDDAGSSSTLSTLAFKDGFSERRNRPRLRYRQGPGGERDYGEFHAYRSQARGRRSPEKHKIQVPCTATQRQDPNQFATRHVSPPARDVEVFNVNRYTLEPHAVHLYGWPVSPFRP